MYHLKPSSKRWLLFKGVLCSLKSMHRNSWEEILKLYWRADSVGSSLPWNESPRNHTVSNEPETVTREPGWPLSLALGFHWKVLLILSFCSLFTHTSHWGFLPQEESKNSSHHIKVQRQKDKSLLCSLGVLKKHFSSVSYFRCMKGQKTVEGC